MSLAFQPITLPCGQTLANRIAKAAMEENLACPELGLAPSDRLVRLYETWSHGGAGLLLSGHVMVDLYAIGGPAPMVLDGIVGLNAAQKEAYRTLIAAAQSGGAKFWLQLNHPGRQAHASAGQTVYGPSEIAVKGVPALTGLITTPKSMTTGQIASVIAHFAASASCAEKLGADGVQIHAAHGYLLSSFLSPLANVRNDEYGGDRARRSRLLFDVVRAVRRAVSSTFAVSVKINSADFQRGGFDEEDAAWVIEQLNREAVDLVEVSGGSYEVPVMQGSRSRSERTIAREAYFLDFASNVAQKAVMPIMVTGGISTRATVDRVVASGKTVAGMASAMCLCPSLPALLKDGNDPCPKLKYYTVAWPLSCHTIIASGARNRQLAYSIHAMSKGNKPQIGVWPLLALLWDMLRGFPLLWRYKKYMRQRAKQNAKDRSRR